MIRSIGLCLDPVHVYSHTNLLISSCILIHTLVCVIPNQTGLVWHGRLCPCQLSVHCHRPANVNISEFLVKYVGPYVTHTMLPLSSLSSPYQSTGNLSDLVHAKSLRFLEILIHRFMPSYSDVFHVDHKALPPVCSQLDKPVSSGVERALRESGLILSSSVLNNLVWSCLCQSSTVRSDIVIVSHQSGLIFSSSVLINLVWSCLCQSSTIWSDIFFVSPQQFGLILSSSDLNNLV